MSRYFIEVSYKGTNYAGFQIQQNANTIQSEVQKALKIFYKKEFELTGSSRTDSGVHAIQNYFHFDCTDELSQGAEYNLNALLPDDISIKKLFKVPDHCHCRFGALSRKYSYYIYNEKNPFMLDRGYFYPYPVDLAHLNDCAEALKSITDFRALSKRRTQVKSFDCTIMESKWQKIGYQTIYTVQANRFLRGMVRGLVGTMLQTGRSKSGVSGFLKVLEERNPANVDFSVPAKGLFLERVEYPEEYFHTF